MTDDNPQPAKRPRRTRLGAGVCPAIHQAPPALPQKPSVQSDRNVRFVYTKRPDPQARLPWEDVTWKRDVAFAELLRQWRADILCLTNMKSEKFRNCVEYTEKERDGSVEIVYRVKRPAGPKDPTEYVGHVRYQGGSDDHGSVDIVIRNHTMDFPDVPPETYSKLLPRSSDQQQKRFSNPKLEKAILALMDDDEGHLHRVRIVSGHNELSFRFDGKPADFFWARQREIGPEDADYLNATIRDLERRQGEPFLEARPWKDTIIAIGESSHEAHKREKVFDSCGRSQGNKWAQINVEDFRRWTKRALFLFGSQFISISNVVESFDWCWTSRGNIIFNERFSDRLYHDGLQLFPWEIVTRTSDKHGLRYGYDFHRLGTLVLTPDTESDLQAKIWDEAVSDYGRHALTHLSSLLKSEPPCREALSVGPSLASATKVKLRDFLTSTLSSNDRPLWYIPASIDDMPKTRAFLARQRNRGYDIEVLPDSYWCLLAKSKLLRTFEEEMQRQKRRESARQSPIVVDDYGSHLHRVGQHEMSSSSSAISSEQSSILPSTEPSTEPSMDMLMMSSGHMANPELTNHGAVTLNSVPSAASESPAGELLSHVLTDSDKILVQRVKHLERELRMQKEIVSTLQTERRRLTTPFLQSKASHVRAAGLDDPAEERVFPVPSGFFPSEVVRLVQACLKLCPRPLDTYTCLPVEVDTGLNSAGFCRFEHSQHFLKVHKDWLSAESMRHNFGSPEDMSQSDLLCQTVLAIWEEVFRLDLPSSMNKHDKRAIWTKCRGDIVRRVSDYRHVLRQIIVPDQLLKYQELSVVTSTLVTSGWAKEEDQIQISVHTKTCPWISQSTRTADPRNRHFEDICYPGLSNNERRLVTEAQCDPGRSCHGVTSTIATKAPFFSMKFKGLDHRNKFCIVAKNLSQPNSLVVILDGYHTPINSVTSHADTPNAAALADKIEKGLDAYISSGYLYQPLLHGVPTAREERPPVPQQQPSAQQSQQVPAPQTMPTTSAFTALPSLERRLKQEQEKLDDLRVTVPPDIAEVETAETIITALRKRIEKERREQRRTTLASLPVLLPPSVPGHLAHPTTCGPPPLPAGDDRPLSQSCLRAPSTSFRPPIDPGQQGQ